MVRRHHHRNSMIKTYHSFAILAGLLLVCISVFLMFISFSGLSEENRIINKNVTVNATLSDVWTKKVKKTSHKSKVGLSSSKKTVTNYYGKARYLYNGKYYTSDTISFGTKHVSTGDTIRLYVDPDAPQKSVAEIERSQSLTFLIAVGTLGFAGLILLITGLISWRKKRRKQCIAV